MKKLILLLGFGGLLLGCEKECTTKDTPACIDKKRQEIIQGDVWSPPAKIYSYQYKGQTVYYLPQRCCDFPSILYDDNCNVICSPDGGFSGEGDGQCKDFFELRTNEKLIWEDLRE